jgi:hypothetical protein
MCIVYDRYTGIEEVVSKEMCRSLNSRNKVNGIRMRIPRYELMAEVNPQFIGKEV